MCTSIYTNIHPYIHKHTYTHKYQRNAHTIHAYKPTHTHRPIHICITPRSLTVKLHKDENPYTKAQERRPNLQATPPHQDPSVDRSTDIFPTMTWRIYSSLLHGDDDFDDFSALGKDTHVTLLHLNLWSDDGNFRLTFKVCLSYYFFEIMHIFNIKTINKINTTENFIRKINNVLIYIQDSSYFTQSATLNSLSQIQNTKYTSNIIPLQTQTHK